MASIICIFIYCQGEPVPVPACTCGIEGSKRIVGGQDVPVREDLKKGQIWEFG